MKNIITRSLFFYFLLNALEGSGIPPVQKNNGKGEDQPELKAFLPSSISESSGLSFTDGKLWTHNDKGGIPAIFSIDTATGQVLQTVYVDNYPNVDWEDITADKEYIYVGDFGNNYGMRKDLKILKIAKASITAEPVVHLKAEAISFSYADQHTFMKNNQNDFDCESLISMDDHLCLFTKNRGNNKTRVYRLPKTPGVYVVEPYTGFNVKGRICGASYNNETHELILLGYMASSVNPFLWRMSNFQDEDFFGGDKKRIEIGRNKDKWKTEGIACISGNRIFISCEDTGVQRAALYSYILP